jgi:hypothetical protein
MIRRMASITAASATYNHQARRTKSEKTVDLAMIFSLLSFCENNFYETGLLVCWYMNAQPLREFPTSRNISAERLCCFPGGDESQLSEKRRRRLEAYRREEFVIRWVS